MDQGLGLWDLLFGVSDPGSNITLKLEDDQGFQLELPEDFLALLNDNQSCVTGSHILPAVEDRKEEYVDATAVPLSDCESMDFASNLECGEPLEVDFAALGDLSEFLQVPDLGSSRSGSEDGSSSECASVQASPKSVHSNSSSSSSLCGDAKEELVLSREEQILLGKESLTLPKFLPLSKQEERVLKKIRRKIRNKKSAQESRRKKKVYVDQLEDQIKDIGTQNKTLQKRVKDLEKENVNLQAQLKNLQGILGRSARNTKTTGTCLMALVLSVALIMTPYGKSPADKEAQTVVVGDYEPENIAPARTRILYNLDTPPDLMRRGIPLAKEGLNLMSNVHPVTSNSVSIEPWQEPFAHLNVPVEQITIKVAPNRSTAAQ